MRLIAVPLRVERARKAHPFDQPHGIVLDTKTPRFPVGENSR